VLRLISICALSLALGAFGTACSTPISPNSPLEEEDDESPLDAGLGGTTRDAGTSTRRDAGAVAGSSGQCARVPLNGVFGSLFDDGCAARVPQPCATRSGQIVQQAVNQWLTDLATKCGVRSDAAIGVAFNRSGCPTSYGYSDQTLRGTMVASCLQTSLESQRLACTPSCALMGSLSR
jgi:hypothetical protein